jgi:hypothetical protein
VVASKPDLFKPFISLVVIRGFIAPRSPRHAWEVCPVFVYGKGF